MTEPVLSSTVNNHNQRVASNAQLSSGQSNPKFDRGICGSCALQDCEFYEHLHLDAFGTRWGWPIVATASARQDQATLKQLQLRLKLRQVEARQWDLGKLHDVVVEGFEFAINGGI